MTTTDSTGHSEAPGAGTELLFPAPRARVRSRRAVLASLLAFSLIAGVIVAGAETAYEAAWILLDGAGLLALILVLFDDLRWGIREVAPYRTVRRLLVSTPEIAGFREALPPLTLHLDGQPASLGAAPRLDLTRSGGRYHLTLVLDREILALGSFDRYEAALERSREVAATLQLSPPLFDHPADVPRDFKPGVGNLVIAPFCTLVTILGSVYWLTGKDFPESVVLPLTLAAVLSSALFGIGWKLHFRALLGEAAESARVSHHFSSADTVVARNERRRSDNRFIAAMGILIVVALIAARWLGAQLLPEPTSCWQSAAPSLCGIDVTGDGVPEAIGYTCVGWGPWASSSLSAIDARSGETTMQLNRAQSSSVAACEPPFLVLNNSINAADSNVSAYRTLLENANSIWRITLHGEVKEILQSKGCALILTHANGREDEWGAFSLSTGEPCTTLPQPVSPEAIDAARQERQRRRPTPSVRTAGDVTYSVTESPRLTLSASRGDMLLWRTELPARPFDELPLAVAGGAVVLGAKDLRTGRYLRILGVDAATGQLRYVRRHPRDPKAHVDLAAAGAMVFIEAGRLAGLDAASGELAWITKEE